MRIKSFLEANSSTFTHIIADNENKVCAIIDPVLNFDYSSGSTSTISADEILDFINKNNWKIKYIIETHAHADHISSAQYIKKKCGGKIVIGKEISTIQKIFKKIYNLDINFKTDASQFDILTEEGTQLELGNINITAMHVPGHTPADMAYKASYKEQMIVFVGDTIFAPDIGTARCDFPEGSANTLYNSIQRLLSLPDNTPLYLCHDYPPQSGENKRDYISVTTVGEQKRFNKHVKEGISQAEFVKMREERDESLSMPQLILPSVQVNIDGGQLPATEDNGIRYIKIPLNALSK